VPARAWRQRSGRPENGTTAGSRLCAQKVRLTFVFSMPAGQRGTSSGNFQNW